MTFAMLIYPLLAVVACLYAVVGHGGASGYLALMALFGTPPEVMRPTALLLNLFVSLTAFLLYRHGRHFNRLLFLPLALASVPMSFLGGHLVLSGALYKHLLGAVLLVPAARFLFFAGASEAARRRPSRWLCLPIGGAIGLLSGMLGIGGGILLSPVLLFLRWTDQKQTAAISAGFIFVNSAAGLLGQASGDVHFGPHMLDYVAAAFGGGLLGASLGALALPHRALRIILAAVLSSAAIKLLTT